MNAFELLKITEEQYQTKVFELWLHWCETKSYSPEQFSKLSQCASLCAWWKQNLEQLEKEFCEDALPYHEIMTANDAAKLYYKHVNKLTLYYSNPLMRIAFKDEYQSKNRRTGRMVKKQSASS